MRILSILVPVAMVFGSVAFVLAFPFLLDATMPTQKPEERSATETAEVIPEAQTPEVVPAARTMPVSKTEKFAQKLNWPGRITRPIEERVTPEDLGNGLYYFPVADSDFTQLLSHFLGKHPEMETVKVVQEWRTRHSSTFVVGHWVTFKNK